MAICLWHLDAISFLVILNYLCLSPFGQPHADISARGESTNNKWPHNRLIIQHGSNSLGRFCWFKLWGQRDEGVLLVMAYWVCHVLSDNPCPHAVYVSSGTGTEEPTSMKTDSERYLLPFCPWIPMGIILATTKTSPPSHGIWTGWSILREVSIVSSH